MEFQLDVNATQALLGSIHGVYHTRINETLLAALLKAMIPWLKTNTLILDLESHGRQDTLVGIHSLNTLGWFTSLFPVTLTMPDMDDPDDWGFLLQSIKQQLRAIPHQGFGYGILRYLSPDAGLRKTLAAQPRPQLSFNYWGQFEQGFSETSLFQWESVGLLAGLKNRRTHLINLDGMLREGRFTLVWTYSSNFHDAETIKRLGQDYLAALNALVQHCMNRNAVVYSTTQTQPQNIYPLTPLQQG